MATDRKAQLAHNRYWERRRCGLCTKCGEPCEQSMHSPRCPDTRRKRAIAKFWARVDQSNGPDACWPWKGCAQRYGKLRIFNSRARAHRVAWELARGPIPDGLKVLHKCDNPPCCNPDHLFIGTQADNMHDMHAKGRHPGRAA